MGLNLLALHSSVYKGHGPQKVAIIFGAVAICHSVFPVGQFPVYYTHSVNYTEVHKHTVVLLFHRGFDTVFNVEFMAKKNGNHLSWHLLCLQHGAT